MEEVFFWTLINHSSFLSTVWVLFLFILNIFTRSSYFVNYPYYNSYLFIQFSVLPRYTKHKTFCASLSVLNFMQRSRIQYVTYVIVGKENALIKNFLLQSKYYYYFDITLMILGNFKIFRLCCPIYVCMKHLERYSTFRHIVDRKSGLFHKHDWNERFISSPSLSRTLQHPTLRCSEASVSDRVSPLSLRVSAIYRQSVNLLRIFNGCLEIK